MSDLGGTGRSGVTLDWLIGQLADALLDRMAARDEGLVDQRDRRGLMGRRHIDAVRARMERERAAGATPTAFQRGREYLLTPAAAREELARVNEPGLVSKASTSSKSIRRGGPRPPNDAARKKSARDEKASVRAELEREMRRERHT